MTHIRKAAFAYSTKCNIRCEHCVAVGETPASQTMDFFTAKGLIEDMVRANVKGISFTAGEPFLFLSEICELIKICRHHDVYTRIVTNAFWAKTESASDDIMRKLKHAGVSQLRISFSKWHQKNITITNILHAAQSCEKADIDYFVSFVTDFSHEDDVYETFLRDNNLKFFPEPLIYAGRAEGFKRSDLFTDYQENCCPMNPYISPDLDMYACCDAGSHFTNTHFFHLGNLKHNSIDELFLKNETNSLYNHIRHLGITAIASFAGYTSREIITYRKCDLCKELFDSKETLEFLQNEADSGLRRWYR